MKIRTHITCSNTQCCLNPKLSFIVGIREIDSLFFNFRQSPQKLGIDERKLIQYLVLKGMAFFMRNEQIFCRSLNCLLMILLYLVSLTRLI